MLGGSGWRWLGRRDSSGPRMECVEFWLWLRTVTEMCTRRLKAVSRGRQDAFPTAGGTPALRIQKWVWQGAWKHYGGAAALLFADGLIRLRPLEPGGSSHIPALDVRHLFRLCRRASWEHLPRAPSALGRLRCAFRERRRRSVRIRNAAGRSSRS